MRRNWFFFFLCFICSSYAISDVPSEEAIEVNREYKSLIEKGDYCGAKEIIYKSQLDGDPLARYQRGLFHYLGHCGEKNLEKAFSELEVASSLGYLDAVYYLGLMYYFGEGVEQDIEIASSIFVLLIRHGHSKTESLIEKLKIRNLVNEDALRRAVDDPRIMSIQEAIEECKVGSKSDFCIQRK